MKPINSSKDRVGTSVFFFESSDGGIPNHSNCTNVVIHHPLNDTYEENLIQTSNVSLQPDFFENVDFPFIDDEFL